MQTAKNGLETEILRPLVIYDNVMYFGMGNDGEAVCKNLKRTWNRTRHDVRPIVDDISRIFKLKIFEGVFASVREYANNNIDFAQWRDN